MGQKTCLLLCLAVLGCIPATGRAQTIAPAVSELSGRVKPGDTVYITESSQPVKGKLIEVSASSLALSVDGHRQDFNLAGVTRVERERRATKKGALIGLLAGAVALPTALAVITENNCGPVRGTIHACDDEWGRDAIFLVFGGIGGGMGAAAGAAIGAGIKHRETVFAASRATPATLSMAPLVERACKGVVLSVRF
jgi:hypothetical protein